MGLIRLALRIATVQALKGATFAGDNVFDSAIAPLEELIKTNGHVPFIAVTTDDDAATIIGRDLLGGERELEIIIEYGIAGKTKAGGITIPHTDEGMEITIDLMQRQITRALVAEETGWSADIKALCPRFHRITSRRGASAEDGVRFAARQDVVLADTINEPDIGVPLAASHPLSAFVDRLEAAGLAKIKTVITEAVLGTTIPDWRRVLTDLGMMASTGAAIGLGDYIEDEDGEMMTSVDAIREHDAGPNTITVDQAAVDDQIYDG